MLLKKWVHLDDINQLLKANSQWKFIVYANLNSIELSAADCFLFRRHEKWWKSFKSHKTHQNNPNTTQMAIVWCMMYKLHVRQQLWNFQVRNDADLMVHSKKKHFFHSIFSEKRLNGENTETTNLSLDLRARARSRIHIKHPNELKQINKRWKPRTKYNRSTAVIYYIACFNPLASIFHTKHTAIFDCMRWFLFHF